MYKKEIRAIFFLFLLSGLTGTAQNDPPIDKKATQETINLYHSLKKLLGKGILFGHQDDLAYGVGWKYIPGKSDIKDVTGDYPSLYGWELGRIEIDQPFNLDSVPFDKMKNFIKEAYERGGVITISWHANNPLTGNSAWQPAPGTVASILPGGEKNGLYKNWLDRIADFMESLKGKNGESIPVIFRLFHELNGSWFWWGRKNCTADELKQLWHFTVAYLRDQKKVHNLLYAYNTDRFTSEEDYLERYPGDEWVDITGFDIYQAHSVVKNEAFLQDLDHSLNILENIAAKKDKIAALTEFGYNGLPDSSWWTTVFLPAIQHHKIAYVLAWRNAGYKASGQYEFYVPYKGQSSAPDFILFHDSAPMIFQKKASELAIYK
jgi:hypothetical protein